MASIRDPDFGRRSPGDPGRLRRPGAAHRRRHRPGHRVAGRQTQRRVPGGRDAHSRPRPTSSSRTTGSCWGPTSPSGRSKSRRCSRKRPGSWPKPPAPSARLQIQTDGDPGRQRGQRPARRRRLRGPRRPRRRGGESPNRPGRHWRARRRAVPGTGQVGIDPRRQMITAIRFPAPGGPGTAQPGSGSGGGGRWCCPSSTAALAVALARGRADRVGAHRPWAGVSGPLPRPRDRGVPGRPPGTRRDLPPGRRDGCRRGQSAHQPAARLARIPRWRCCTVLVRKGLTRAVAQAQERSSVMRVAGRTTHMQHVTIAGDKIHGTQDLSPDHDRQRPAR